MPCKYVALVPSVLFLLVVVACDQPAAPDTADVESSPSFHATVDGNAVVLEGMGVATVDGVRSPGEWEGAGIVTFDANLPLTEGGGTTPVTLRAMNDVKNLYLSVEVVRARANTEARFNFDNDHDDADGNPEIIEEGDDQIFAYVSRTGVAFADAFWTFLPPCEYSMCGFLDTEDYAGNPLGGSIDGDAAATSDGVVTFIELSHPLDSNDDEHDFRLAFGDTVGFHLGMRFHDPAGPWPEGYGDTDFPGPDYLPGWGDIVIFTPAPEVLVTQLQAQTQLLVDDETLKQGRALLQLLDTVLARLNGDRTNAAVRQLRAFTRIVSALVNSGQLPDAEGSALIELAELVIVQLR
jgi:hypothetical protein